MAKIIKKHWDITLIVGIGFALAISIFVGMGALRPGTNDALAVATTVSVTATVSEWLTFTSSETSVSLSPNLVDTAGGTAIGSSTAITLTVGTNSIDGYSVTASSSKSALTESVEGASIASVSATGTIAAGEDGYGANATSTESTISATYNWWGTTNVGQLAGATTTLSYTDPTDANGHATSLKIYAACDKNQKSGTYTDTITLTATATP